MSNPLLAILSGGVGLLILGIFISAIRISYAIDKATKPPPSFPRYTNIWGNLLGADKSDPEAVGLVAKLRMRMFFVALLFIPLAIVAYRA